MSHVDDILREHEMKLEMGETGRYDNPDMAKCEDCEWRGKISKCETVRDGDYESGYFSVDTCPECGACVEYYDSLILKIKRWLFRNFCSK